MSMIDKGGEELGAGVEDGGGGVASYMRPTREEDGGGVKLLNPRPSLEEGAGDDESRWYRLDEDGADVAGGGDEES